MSYFNNAIICNLVEGRPVGIIALLDEECLRPGNTSDATFLTKLSSTLGSHAHFVSHGKADAKVKKTLNRDCVSIAFTCFHNMVEISTSTQFF